MVHSLLCRTVLVALLLIPLSPARAAEVVAAVAANFAAAISRIEPGFEQATGHQLTVVLGSSGKFVQQIQQGAPLDVFLSADAERPELLAKSNLGVPTSRFTYAIGRLALWSPDPKSFSDGEAYLKAGTFRHLAIANPAVAPYGAAAQRVLEQLGLWAGLQDRIVRAEDIGQVYAMAGSGAAEAAFVAYSSVLSGNNPGSQWLVPQNLYPPLKQDAILITRAQNNPAAKALLDYLKTPAAREVITSLGYDVPAP
jgi:molybdate transport system substrate-binding protein